MSFSPLFYQTRLNSLQPHTLLILLPRFRNRSGNIMPSSSVVLSANLFYNDRMLLSELGKFYAKLPLPLMRLHIKATLCSFYNKLLHLLPRKKIAKWWCTFKRWTDISYMVNFAFYLKIWTIQGTKKII